MVLVKYAFRRLWFLIFPLLWSSCGGIDKGSPSLTGPLISNGVGGIINNDVTGGVGRIAFMRRSLESGSYHIYTIKPDGTSEVNLNEEADLATYSGPSWSADGKQIAFASDRSGSANYNIYLMNLDGSDLREIVQDTGGDFAPALSPDGQKILFQSWRINEKRWDIYVVNADGSGEKPLISTNLDEQLPSWSPDGSKILYQAGLADIGTDIYLANADGSGSARLTSGNGRLHSSPSWSPDGAKIAFESNLHQSILLGFTPVAEYELYIIDANGGNLKRLTFDGGVSSQVQKPTWSPDGTQIAFEYTSVSPDVITTLTALVVMRIDGSNLFVIPNMPNGGLFPRWSPVP
jgi:Tol biopolymer transport system component